jgi:hypothetical protein
VGDGFGGLVGFGVGEGFGGFVGLGVGEGFGGGVGFSGFGVGLALGGYGVGLGFAPSFEVACLAAWPNAVVLAMPRVSPIPTSNVAQILEIRLFIDCVLVVRQKTRSYPEMPQPALLDSELLKYNW